MNASLFITRNKESTFFSLLLFSLAALFGWAPEAEASTSGDKKKISKLKKTVKKLKRQLAGQQIIQVPFPVTVAPPTPEPFVEMVTVGNVGNVTDAGNPSEASVYGAVPYEFQIGKYEVSLDEYTAFLNAVAASDTYALYNSDMAMNLNIAGIERSGADGSYTYAVIGSGNRPVTYVSWFDAARFCNWLHNGRPTGAQDATTTERGAYTLDGATTGIDFSRNPGAKYWIPIEDEWYKAAFHQPAGEGGDSDDFWTYPTASNLIPGNFIGQMPEQANYVNGSMEYSVTHSAILDPNQNYLTDRGAYEGSAGPYGTFDQGGNVFEWNDGVVYGLTRSLRGGSWRFQEDTLRSSARGSGHPYDENNNIGFRVASP